MGTNRKKAKRQRQRARERFKARGERQLLQRIETALTPAPAQQLAGGAETGRVYSYQPNVQSIPRARQRIIDSAEEYRKQYRAQQGL